MWLFRLTAPFFCWSSWEGKQKQSTKNAIITQPTYRNQRSGSKIKHGKSCGCHHKIAYIYINVVTISRNSGTKQCWLLSSYSCSLDSLRIGSKIKTPKSYHPRKTILTWIPKSAPYLKPEIHLKKNSSIFGISMSDFFWVLYSKLGFNYNQKQLQPEIHPAAIKLPLSWNQSMPWPSKIWERMLAYQKEHDRKMNVIK